MSPGRSATMPTTSWVASWTRERGLGRGDRPCRPTTRLDLELAPERRRLRVQPIGLVGLGRQVDGVAEARPPWAPPASRSSPLIGGPVVRRGGRRSPSTTRSGRGRRAGPLASIVSPAAAAVDRRAAGGRDERPGRAAPRRRAERGERDAAGARDRSARDGAHADSDDDLRRVRWSQQGRPSSPGKLRSATGPTATGVYSALASARSPGLSYDGAVP